MFERKIYYDYVLYDKNCKFIIWNYLINKTFMEMENNDNKNYVKKEIENIKEILDDYTKDDFKNGTWFYKLLKNSISNYSKTVNADYLKKKYNNIPIEAIVEKRIVIAKEYATIEAFLSSSTYSASVIATIGTAGGSSPLTVSTAFASFVVDLLYTTQLQLKLAYDISVLYGQKIDIDDPEDLIDLIKIAFGIKVGEQVFDAAQKLLPEAIRIGIKQGIKGHTLEIIKALPVVGKYLLQRNIIKVAIPAVSIPFATGFNYYYTGKVGIYAKKIYRDRSIIKEKGKLIFENTDNEILILLKTLWLISLSDGKIDENEIRLLKSITDLLKLDDDSLSILNDFNEKIITDENTLIDEIQSLDKENQRNIFNAACIMAAIDKKIKPEEIELLTKIASKCQLKFDIDEIKRMTNF